MKKIVVLGKGTGGAVSAAFYSRHYPNATIEWIYDPSIPTQAVGEGLNITPVAFMNKCLDFMHIDLEKIDGTFKMGIHKDGWGETGAPFFHDFVPPSVAYHINAVKLQKYIFDLLHQRSNVKFTESNTTSNDIDADLVIDCSGRPKEYDDFVLADHIPVNSVYVTQCFWDHPRFQYSLTNAAKHGWYFGIPLQNRCAIGYMYNNNMSTLDEVKEDVQHVFEKYNLTPSDTTNAFSFKNYYRKKNYVGNIVYNGNASIFLEPLEATTIGFMVEINRSVRETIITRGIGALEQLNDVYTDNVKQISDMIMLHYFAGSKYKSKFWDHAQNNGIKHINNAMNENDKNNKFYKIIHRSLTQKSFENDNELHGTWPARSYRMNINGLNIGDKLKRML